MRTAALLTTAALVFGFTGACDSSEKSKGDAPRSAPDADASPAPAQAATVFLRGRVDGDRARVEVVVRGAPRDLHGAAFRLRWPAHALTFVEARTSDAWSPSAIRLAKEGLPGELVVVWSEKGQGAGVRTKDETVLGSLDFTVTAKGSSASAHTELLFRPERSTLRDASGTPMAVEWLGWKDSPR